MYIFLKVCNDICRTSDKDVFPKRPQIMSPAHIFDSIAQNVCCTADFQTFEKLCESKNFVIM